MNRLISLFFILAVILSFSVGSIYAQGPSPSPTGSAASPTATPINSPNSCNGTCGSDNNCQSGLVCYGEPGATTKYCRNPSCQSQTSCTCPTTTATPTSTPVKTLTPSPTARPTTTPTFTPSPMASVTPEPTEEPTPTESSVPVSEGGGIGIKGVAIGALVLGLLIIVGGILYLKFKNKRKIPPIGVFGS